MTASTPRKPRSRQQPRVAGTRTAAKPGRTERAVQPRGDAVVEKILKGGMDLFLEHGFAGTSVDAVAQRTRTSKATIYRYFPDKEALFTAMVDRAIAEGRKLPEVDTSRSHDVRQVLLDFAERCIERSTSPRQLRLCRAYIFEIQKFEVIEKLFSRFDDRDYKAQTATITTLIAGRVQGVDNPARAAATFWYLAVVPFIQWALFRPRSAVTARERQTFLEDSIDEFLKIYPPT